MTLKPMCVITHVSFAMTLFDRSHDFLVMYLAPFMKNFHSENNASLKCHSKGQSLMVIETDITQ